MFLGIKHSFLRSSHATINTRPLNSRRNSTLRNKQKLPGILSRGFDATFKSNTTKVKNDQQHSEFDFNTEQKKVLDLVLKGKKSVFITGAAGTGKTILLREIVRQLKSQNQRGKFKKNSNTVLVTATTGLAAYHIGGLTYHKALGIINLAEQITPKKTININKGDRAAWEQCKVLLIDEVSMMDNITLDLIDKTAREIRNNPVPFGGIQVILSGDFFQLPPIDNSTVRDIIDKYTEQEAKTFSVLFQSPETKSTIDDECDYAFNSKVWHKAFKYCLSLSTVYRQLEDPEFAECLNEVRVGNMSSKTLLLLNKVAEKPANPDINGTSLFGTKKEVALHNQEIMDKMKGPLITYKACFGGKLKDTDDFTQIDDNSRLVESVSLKIGSLVMVTNNIDLALYNGTSGIVIGFEEHNSSGPNARVTIKSQLNNNTSMSENNLDIKNQQDRQADDRTIQLDISDVNKKAVLEHEGSKENEFKGKRRLYPVFLYYNINLSAFRERIITPMTTVITTRKKNTVLHWKTQIPLACSWGLTIHKSQGQTYKTLRCDFKNIFAKGQAYVALSRVKSREGLQLLNWDPEKVICDQKVVEFHEKYVKDIK